MGIETSAEHGGAESSFTSAIIAIEELARVDPSVSVMCDVHNTLVNTVVRKYGSPEQKENWLPKLAESTVREHCGHLYVLLTRVDPFSLGHFACRSLHQGRTRSHYKHALLRTGTTG